MTDSTDSESRFDIDVVDAERFLSRHLGRDVAGVELVGEGAWSKGFGFVDADRDLVVRFGRFVDDFEKDRRAGAFNTSALPIPEVIEIGAAFDGYFAISTRAHGRPLETCTTAEWEAVLPAVWSALDDLRRADISATTGYGGWDSSGHGSHSSWREFVLAVDTDSPQRRTHGWRRKLIDSSVGDRPFRAGLTKLAELVDACPNERHLIHADLINRNVLVEDDLLTGVFDWGCSSYGDFVYDLAWLAFWSPWHPALEAIDIRAAAIRHFASTAVTIDDLDARLRCCMLHIGLDHQAYCAHTGDEAALIAVTEQTTFLLD
ncbi:MAG TPA: aminoglycoside phosphotransferase family protein [Ilumatobacteraceae bacterium]|nr:aminoglycoside phosphotransferase family protein [Ilumatobacteraceae bacterium]